MGENSSIEWCDHTFNPWMGCTKVSVGCQHCYAEAQMDHRYGKVKWGPQGTRVRTAAANWKKPLVWNKKAQLEGRRYRVFCASLADVFEDRPELVAWRADLFDLIAKTPNLDWLLLTKRPENIMPMLIEAGRGFQDLPDHIWIGCSVENQEQADKRIPELRKVPAKVLFISCEPLLSMLNLDGLAYEAAGPEWAGSNKLIDWVIAGGESGPNARPMNPAWARSLRDQCVAAGIAFHFKQWGEYVSVSEVEGDGFHHYFADGRTVRKVGKKAAGRLLDGVEWNEMPEAVI